MRTLSLFNNKGGVGKTTLSSNIAHDFAQRGCRVLYVDCDPQCNATQLMLDEYQTEEIYATDSSSQDPLRSALSRTVYGLFIPLREGEPEIDRNIHVAHSERFGVDVLAGHPNLSQIEDLMSEAWQTALGRQTAAFRRVHWAGQLVTAMEDADRYDIVMFDVGPSLGPFNRTVLLGCDAFVTPTSTDLFSYHAFGNLARWFEDWTEEYGVMTEGNLHEWNKYSSDVEAKARPLRLHSQSGRNLKYLGFTTLEYIKRTSGGKEQLVGAFERFRGLFAEEAHRIADSLGQESDDYLLGRIPHMYSMPATAQDAHSPIAGLSIRDGVRGSQLNQKNGYVEHIQRVSEAIYSQLMETN
ncbi:MAG TPA: AAA family ATPase [Actinomyces sp.]|nr:AAA family ATPase [Actinomyces sp.]